MRRRPRPLKLFATLLPADWPTHSQQKPASNTLRINTYVTLSKILILKDLRSELTFFKMNTYRKSTPRSGLSLFRINTYKKARGGVGLFSCHLSRTAIFCPLFSCACTLFQVPYTLSPLLPTLTKTAGCRYVLPDLAPASMRSHSSLVLWYSATDHGSRITGARIN